MTDIIPHPGPGGEFLLYQTEDGRTRVQCRLQSETVWLTQAAMAELFQIDKSCISRYFTNIYVLGELSPDSVVAKYATTAAAGKLEDGATCKDYLQVRSEVGNDVECMTGILSQTRAVAL